MSETPIADFKTFVDTCEAKLGGSCCARPASPINPSWTPTTLEHFDYFLECVPPAFMENREMDYGACACWFACGEAHHHRGDGRAVFLCFKHLPGQPPAARYATIPELKNEMRETHKG